MRLKNVNYTAVFRVMPGGNTYRRVNASRDVVPRIESDAVVINTVTNKLRLLNKATEVSPA